MDWYGDTLDTVDNRKEENHRKLTRGRGFEGKVQYPVQYTDGILTTIEPLVLRVYL